MAVSHVRPARATGLRSAASAKLRAVVQKCMSILPDMDPMMQIMAVFLAIKLADGFTLDKDTVVGTGVLAMMLIEELI